MPEDVNDGHSVEVGTAGCQNCETLSQSLLRLELKLLGVLRHVKELQESALLSEVYPSGIKGERHYPAGDYA